MNKLIVKRLNKELGENWEIVAPEEPKIRFYYTIAHSKRRPVGFGVFDCALATVTLTLINLICYIQHLGYAEMAIYKSAVYTIEDFKPPHKLRERAV